MSEDVRNLKNSQTGDEAAGSPTKWDVSRSEMIDEQLKEQVLGIRSLRKTADGRNVASSATNESFLHGSNKFISNSCDSSNKKSSLNNQNSDQVKAGGSVSKSKQKHNMLGDPEKKWTPGSAPKKTCRSSSAAGSGSSSSKKQSSAGAKVAAARAKSRDAVANTPLWQKSVCCLLAFVLCFQMFFTNGVTTAIAESTSSQDSQVAVVQSDENSGDSNSLEGDTSASTSENSSSQVISDTSEKDAAVISDTNANGDSNEASGIDSGIISDTSEKESKNEAVAKDWTDVKDNLSLKTDGLNFEESLARQAEKIASQFISDTSENVAAAISDTSVKASKVDDVVLPTSLMASLNIRATLNAAAAQGRDGDDAHKTIVDGDNFIITLPNKVTADFSSSKLRNEDGKVKANVYAVDKDTNKASDKVIGTAEISENSIKIILNSDAAGVESVDAIIDLDVLVSSELVQAEESTIDWTMQKDTEAAKLTIPSKETIAAALGLLISENGDGDDSNIATLAGDDEVTSQVGDKKKVQSGTTKAQDFVTNWADNNNSDRPTIDSMVANQEYRLYYSLDGGTTKKTLTTDGVTLTDEAKADLGISSLTPVSGSLVKVEKTKTNEFTISSAVSLPQTIITKELKRIDEDEETGEKTEVWEDIDTKTVSYYIRHDYAGTTKIQYDDQGAPENPQIVYNGEYLIASRGTLKSEDREQNKYISPFKEETISLLSEESFNVKYNFGDGISDEWSFLDFFFENPDAQFLNAQIGSETYSISGDQIMAFYDAGFATGRWTDSGDHHKTAIFTIRHPQYYPDGSPITYSYQQQSVNQDTDSEFNDEWQIIYDNTQGTNHGSDASAVYAGGTITFTHYGTTKYSAAKKWLDDDASARPATTYSLWRFVDNGTGDYGTASQVKAGDSSGFIEFTISAEDNQKAGSNEIDLGAYLNKQLKATNTMLAKYDQDGYPYVYMLREDALPGYERLFGTTVNTDTTSPDYGKIVKGTDTKPNYYKTRTSDGTETASIAKDERPSSDLSVYNNGTLINRHSSTTSAQATKTWIIGSFQDQLSNVSATFQLQRIAKEHAKQNEDGSWSPNGDKYPGTDNPIGWSDVEGQTVEMTGWSAESLTKTLTASAAKYDAEGKEFVYRWIETDVRQDGESTAIPSQDGVTNFYLQLKDNDGSTQYVWFDVNNSYDAQTGALTIVNKYRNETEANVHKYWATTEVIDGQTVVKKDDAGNTIWNQDEKPNGQSQSVTVTLVQTGSNGRVAFGPFTLDGTADDQAKEIQGLDGATYQEKTSWNMVFQNLPMYDENGSKYTYMAFEGDVPGFLTQRAYYASKDGELNVTDIYNTPGPGEEWSDIRVAKSWTDGGNTSSRTPVKVGIYAGRDMDNAKYREWVDGGKQGDMPAGAVHYDKGDLITTTTLTESKGWYWEGGVAISGVVQENGDIYIRELSNDETGESKTTVITKEDAEKDEAGTYFEMLRNWNDNSKNQFNERMFAGEKDVNEAFCYQVNYGYDETLKALDVDNQRLGQVWIQLSKEWNDQGHVGNRPDCRFKITCNDDSVTFFDKDGVIYAKVSDNIEFKIFKNYKEGEEVEALTTSDATITDDGHALLRNIDTSDNADVMYVGALPKYNASGFVIDYSVSEEITTQGTEYSGGQTYFSENYDSPWHFTDSLVYEYTNSRSGTKDVAFNTRWYDVFVEEDLNQRPDVYVTLYKTVYQYDSQGNLIYNDDGTPACTYEVVTGYENYRWSTLVDGNLSGKYNERAVVKNLPKYDSRGKEIVYYATVMSNTSDYAFNNLHYQKQWHTTTMIDKSGKDAGNQIWDDHNASDPEITKSSDEAKVGSDTLALREDGTFNFEIAAPIQVQGYKIWKNVPGNYETDELPKISIYLQRRVANSDTAWQMPHFTAADNEQGYTIDDMVGAEGSDVADGKTVVAATHNLNFVSTGKYLYSMKYYGVNTTNDLGDIAGEITDALELPRYDADGRLYEYRTFEVIDGLLSTADNPVPGGFTIDQLNNMSGETVGNPDLVFVTTQGEGSAFSIANAYDAQYGKLTVKKIYEGFQQGDKLADATFTLYRYYIKSDGTASAAEKVDQKTITADQFSSDGVGQTTFENVDIYAPDGQYWVYYTTETNIDGYVTYSMLGNATGADDSSFKQAEADETNGGWLSPDSYKTEGESKYPSWTPVADDDVPDFSFKNNYEPESIKLNGTKVWRDNDNLANTRPENITITLKRTYKNGDADQSLDGGKVPLQETDENAANYLKWTKTAKGDWTYTISNLEKWATDGNAWVYSVTEESSSLDGTEYVITKNGGSVTAADGAKLPDIINELKTIVTPKKTWENDNEDWLAQRPTFYYQLQARVQTDSNNWGDWAEVVTAFYASGKFDVDWEKEYPSTSINMGSAGKLNGHVMKTSYGTLDSIGVVSPDGRGKNWTGSSWDNLPLSVSNNNVIYKIQYRVVEKGMQYVSDGQNTVIKFDDPDADGNYTETYHPYQPSISSVETTDQIGRLTINSVMKNTLDQTQLEVEKSWKDDDDNSWATRPGTKKATDAWTLQFALQRTTNSDEGIWEWVTTRGVKVNDSEALNSDGTFNEKLRVVELSSNSADFMKVFDNLPKTDTDGNTYTYRAVERLTGSYALVNISGDVIASALDGRVKLVTVAATLDKETGKSSVSFENALNTVGLQGTKTWNAYGDNELIPNFDTQKPTMELQKSTDGVTWTKANKADGSQPTITWEKVSDTVWKYSYTGLPQTDNDGVTLKYRAVEKMDAKNGYVDSYDGKGYYDSDNKIYVNDGITNTATRFTFKKLGDATTGSDSEELNGVTLKVRDSSNTKTYAVWMQDDGVMKSYVNYDGVTEAATAEPDLSKFTEIKDSDDQVNAGWILALPAGTYKVTESRVPDGHVRTADFNLTISIDGVVSANGTSGKEVSIKVVDPVLRGDVELYKFYKHSNDNVEMPGMTFDLYKGTADGENVKIAENVVLQEFQKDSSGKRYGWITGATATDAMVLTYLKGDDGTSLLGKYYETTKDGLPEGNYFFKETGASPYTVEADTTYAFTISKNSDTSKQPANVYCSAENTEFNATASLAKVNSETGEALSDVKFKLEYKAAGTDIYVTLGSAFATGKTYAAKANMAGFNEAAGTAGALKFTSLKKGDYRLTEVSNTGYEVPTGDNAVVATWTIAEADQNKDFNLLNDQAVTWTNAVFKDGSLSNTPLHGAIQMKKVSSASASTTLNDAVFGLYVKAGNDWTAVNGGESLVTGKAYNATVDEAGNVTAIAEDSTASAPAGTITVTNLPWGTYRFEEVAPADGYIIGTADGKCISGEITINRENVAGSATTPIGTNNVQNTPSSLKLYKTNSAGKTNLGGAKFTVEGDFVSGHSVKTLLTEAKTGEAKPVTADDSVEGEMIVGKTYTITETLAPKGYTLIPETATIQVKLNADGTFTAVGDTPEGWSIKTDGGVSLLFRSDEMTNASLAKRGENGTPLQGSEFVVEGEMADGSTSFTLAPSGENAIDSKEGMLIVGKTYEVKEIKVPLGYAKLPDVTIRALENGKIEFVDEQHDGWTIEGDYELIAQDNIASFKLAKTNTSGQSLVNATFNVEGEFVIDADEGTAEKSTIEYTVTGASADNSGITGLLVEGTTYVNAQGQSQTATGDYVISEKSAPSGYISTDKTFAIHVNADGSVEAKDGQGSDLPYTFDSATKTVTLSNPPIALTFKKAGLDKKALTGALFTIKGKFAVGDGQLTEEKTIEGASIDTLSAMKFAQGQTYELTETTAPRGYELIEGTLKFSVTNAGKIEISSAVDGYTVDDAAVVMTATDTAVEVAINKKAEDGSALAGAEFSLVPGAHSSFADGSKTAITLTTTDDGSVNVPAATLVAENSYILTETKAPAGYKKIEGQFTFTVAKDGAITGTSAGVKNGSFEVASGNIAVDVSDEIVPFSLVKYSSEGYGTENIPLKGAVFTVTPEGDSTFADGTTAAITFTTGTDGKGGVDELTGKLVVGERYSLKEVTAPDGYKLISGEMKFIVNNDGSISAYNAAPSAYHTTESGQVVVFTGDVTDDPTRIVVRKVSAESTTTSYAGATFELKPADGSTFADGSTAAVTATTAGDKGKPVDAASVTGFAEFDKALVKADGTSVYEIRETVAPWGFKVNTYVASFTVATDGSIQMVDSEEATAEGYDVTDDGLFTLTVKDMPIDISLKKVDEDNNNPLANATFTVKAAEGTNDDGEANHFANGSTSDVYALVTDTDGLANLKEKLVAGNCYVVTETDAPDGFGFITEDLQIKVATDGTITKVSGPDAYSITEDGIEINALDKVIDLTLQKVASDEAESAAMAGAQFVISPEGEGSTFAGGVTDPITLTVGDNGFTDSLAGKLVAGSSYRIHEAKAPAGYKLITDDLVVEVAKDGTITIAKDSESATAWTLSEEDGAFVVTGTDEPVKVALNKADESKTEMTVAGAKYELTGNFAKGDGTTELQTRNIETKDDGTLVVDEEDTPTINDLVAGETYTLVEVDAPFGYEVDSTPLKFTVDENGRLSLAEGETLPDCYEFAEAEYSDAGVISVIVQIDSPIEITINKKSLATLGQKDDPMLEGAVYKMTAEFMAPGDKNAIEEKTYYIQTLADGSMLVGELEDMTDAVKCDVIGGIVTTDGELSYTIQEIKAPDGYELNEQVVNFGINDDGTIALVAAADNTYSAEGETMTVRNQPIEVTLYKTDASNTALKGAEFEIRALNGGKFTDNNEIRTVVSGEDGTVVINGLIQCATYELKETKAPTGYDKVADVLTFTVGTDGKVTFASGSSAKYSLNDAADRISVVNTKTPAGKIPVTGDQLSLAAILLALGGSGTTAALLRRRKRDEQK